MSNAVSAAKRVSLESLQPFVPLFVRERLARDPSPLTQPCIEHFPAAVLFADLTGFTPLAEELSKQGARGAEQLKEILDICFGKLVELASAFAGDVIKFPGDGALVLWRVQQGGDLAGAVRLASKCGLILQETLDGLVAAKRENGEVMRLRLRAAIAAGPAFAASVGGSENCWEFVVGGDALSQIAIAAKQAEPGEVACSPQAWTLLEARTAKAAGMGCRILRDIEPSLPPPCFDPPQLPLVAEPALRQYIPPAIQTRLDAGQADWLAEFRHVSVMFVNVQAADLVPAGAPDLLQAIATTLQRAIHRYDGGVNELVMDDKGLTMVAAWGQSLATHDDDPSRACQAGLQALRDLRQLGVSCGIGIATGNVFVGARGGPSRMEYAIIGDAVNLAARLTATASDAVLCDASTRGRSRHHLVFESLPAVRLKGKAEPVAVFRPLGVKQRWAPGRQPLFGRQQEQMQLAARLDALAQRQEGGVAVIQGDAGIGKSRMITFLLEQTQALTVRSLMGSAEDLERSSSYFAWRGVLNSALRLDRVVGEARTKNVLERLESGQQRTWSPLLNAVLGLDLEENETTSRLTAEARAERTRQLLVQLLRGAVRDTPTMIVLEDAHWLDSSSWALAEAARRAIPTMLLVIVSRPLSREHMPEELRRFLENPDTVHVRLTTLSAEEALALVSHRLGVDSLPEAVARLIQEKAEGHPLFIEQFASTLGDQGVIRVSDGECVLTANAASIASTRFPETVQAVVRGRIDRLTQEQQLTLKTASVLGRVFRVSEIGKIHPIPTDILELRKQLEVAVELDLLRPAADQDSYSFKHAITQDVAYGMLPYAQRRQLHRAVAEELEHRGDLAEILPRLAHHWAGTEDVSKAVDYLEKAGKAALAAFANREAVSFFSRALDLDDTQGIETLAGEFTVRRAHWHRQIGEALFVMGDIEGSFKEARKSLEVLGYPIPDSRSGKVRMLAKQAAVQAAHLAFPGRFVELEPHRRARLGEAAEASARCAWIKNIRRDSLGLIANSLASVNWAQNAARQSVLPLVIVAYSLGSLKMRRLSEKYFALARANAMELKQFQQLAWAAVMECQNLLSSGQLSRCSEILDETFHIVQSTGDREMTALLSSVQGIVANLQGRFDAAMERTLFALDLLGSEPSNNRPYALYTTALIQFALSRPPEARARIEEYVRKAREVAAPEDRLIPMFCAGLEAALYTRLGDWERARKAAAQAAAYGIRATSPPSWCPSLLFEAHLGLWEHWSAENSVQAAEIGRATRRALWSFRFYAWLYPVHQPRFQLVKGQIAWLSASHSQAMKAWRRGLHLAEKLGLAFEQGLLHYELGRRSPVGSPERTAHLQTAERIASQCNALYYLDAINALLAGETSEKGRA